MIRFVTSFSPSNYKQYAKNMLQSVVNNWKNDLKLIAYYHDFTDELVADLPQSPLIEYRDLNKVSDMLAYRDRMKKYDGTMGGTTSYNWRMDAVKWCHKIYALTDLALEISDKEVKGGWLCWLDADTVTNKPLSEERILQFLDNKAELAHLGRTDVDYSETSFIAFNLDYIPTHHLIADLRGCYDIHEVISYREWHDGFIFERLLKIYTAHGMKVQNLSPNVKGLEAFKNSPLSQYMEHFKGNLKLSNAQETPSGIAQDVKLPRYRQLADLVRAYAPLAVSGFEPKIVEVGTWNGGRAIEMALAAFEKCDTVHYVGFDLFEEATEELDELELNSKRHNTLEAVQGRLTEFAAKMKEQKKTFSFKLFKGNSKETVPASKWATDGASFAYIDGGHSEETVNSDYESLKDTPFIVFDDYFTKDENDKILGDEHLGTNRLVQKLGKKFKCIVLPSQDRVKGGGITHIVAMFNKKDLPPLPRELTRQPIIVRPRDCMPKDYIINNINENLDLIKNWELIKNCKVNDEHAIIVSAGPSLDYAKLRYVIKKTKGKVIAVKHSYPKLLENGIQPWACVVLDPRPITGVSTHGIVRSQLFKNIDKETKFLVASMTDPSVTKYISKRTNNVHGWHAYSEAIKQSAEGNFELSVKANIPPTATFVTGGTCAALRAIGMHHILGFRQFHLFGFDCSLPSLSEKQKKEKLDDKPKYLRVETDGDEFWTTGELLAMAQDCEKLFNSKDVDMNIHFYGKDTLAAKLYTNSYHSDKTHYMDYYNAFDK